MNSSEQVSNFNPLYILSGSGFASPGEKEKERRKIAERIKKNKNVGRQ